MYDIYYTLRTVTRGQRGREALRRAGIPGELIRASRAIAPGGCAYALRIRARDLDRAERVLAEARVPVEGRFRRLPAGDFGRLER